LLDNDANPGDKPGGVEHRALKEGADFSHGGAHDLDLIDVVLTQPFCASDTDCGDLDRLIAHDVSGNRVNCHRVGACDEQIHLDRRTLMRTLAFHGNNAIHKGQICFA